MLGTANYLYRALRTFVGVWDTVVPIASSKAPTDVSPSPPSDPNLSEADDAELMAPIRNLLYAEDLAPQIRDGFDTLPADNHQHFFHKRSCKDDCDLRHGAELDPGRSDFQQHTVQWDEDITRFRLGNSNPMPQHLPEYIQRGLLMEGVCEFAVHLLMSAVERVVKLLDSEAQVIWLLVLPRRRLQFVTPVRPGSRTPRDIALCHSVLLIRSPRSGSIILDPTLEQYGHPREHRILTWNDYEKLYILRKDESLGGKVCCTNHEYRETIDGDNHPAYEYFRDAESAVNTCVDEWIQNMKSEEVSLRDSLDDKGKCRIETEMLMTNVVESLNRIPTQSMFAFGP
ncbi:hypothetical protein OPT61_g3660 [Boeremia exigua]|uniref:Uncharacterized protein n=1 Tax=Boeremia exigua TaxID=749465 RepID=A0ACC2IGX5_9PLEO|nr:hypothetical protein OPT61_g3660 [Boeremia exigua]